MLPYVSLMCVILYLMFVSDRTIHLMRDRNNHNYNYTPIP